MHWPKCLTFGDKSRAHKVHINHPKCPTICEQIFKPHSKHKQQDDGCVISRLFWGIEFLLCEACTLTTEDTDPWDENRLKKVRAYSSIDSTKCCVLVEQDSKTEETAVPFCFRFLV